MKTIMIDGIDVRQNGELFCLNDLHKAIGSSPANGPDIWVKTQQACALVQELHSKNELPMRRVLRDDSGVWGSKELFYAYAIWLSPAFLIHILKVYDGILSRQLESGFAVIAGAATGLVVNALKHDRRGLLKVS